MKNRMMKGVLASTAVALMMSTSGIAATTTNTLDTYQSQSMDIRASNFIGMRVYANENRDQWSAWEQNASVDQDDTKEWDDIGEINDVILGHDGQVKAVIIGVGGFLGMGEKDVAVTMSSIKMVNDSNDKGDYFLVVNTNKEALNNAEAYKTADTSVDQQSETTAKSEPASKPTEAAEMTSDSAAQNNTANTEMKAEADATADVKDQTAMNDEGANQRTLLPRPIVEREGYLRAEPAELTADRLEGARVYGSNDEDVGEINRLVLNDDGKIEKVVIDVGGFLGIGEHPVAVTFEELEILRSEDGSDFRVYIDATQENLESQPEYQG